MVTGRIDQGKIKVGEKVQIIGMDRNHESTCTGVEMFRKLMDEGQAGDNVGLLLRGIERTDVERGQVVAAPNSITPHTKFKGEVYVLTKEEGGRHTPFFNGYRPQFYFRTTDVTGVVTLPAIKVPWFNVKTNQVEIAELPAKTIRVKVNQSTAKPSTHVHVSSPSPRLSAPPASALRPILKQYGLWGMLSVFGLSAAFFGYRNARSRVNLLAAVRGACKANDPVQAREALLKWAKQSWPQAVLLDLSDIAKLVNDDVFKTQLLLLSAALYASKSTSLWQGQGLWAALQRLKRSPSVGGKKRKQVLPSIYPE